MSGPDDRIVEHYTKGGLFDQIINGLAAMGKTTETLQPEDLKPVDEFHIGGIEATEDLLGQLGIGTGTQVLDIGSGIGGTARHIVARHGANCSAVD